MFDRVNRARATGRTLVLVGGLHAKLVAPGEAPPLGVTTMADRLTQAGASVLSVSFREAAEFLRAQGR